MKKEERKSKNVLVGGLIFVLLIGLGGVGGYSLETLIRAGIENIILVDYDIVDISIDENEINIIFALSKRIDENNFSYIGSKRLKLLYNKNSFTIESIISKYL